MTDQNATTGQSAQAGGYQAAYAQPTASSQPAAAAGNAYAPGAQHAATAGVPVPPDRNQHGKKGSGGKTFLIAFAGALAACLVAFGAMGALSLFNGAAPESNNTASLGAESSTVINVDQNSASLAEAVASKCLPSVAAIDVFTRSGGGNDIYSFIYGNGAQGSGELEASGLGSGVVLSNDGYIVTNYHVVEGGEAYEVTVGGETYEADLVGSDPSSDVAVLKARDAKGLTAMEIGDSDDLTIGEWVMSIGSPFGLEQSVATGIISATSRSQIINSSNGSSEASIYPNMIQTDAAINPGNSGGALVDANGQLVGINTLITSYSGNYSGVGFAIPVNYAINLAQQIIDGKNPTHAQLGVSLNTVNSQMAARYGLSANEGAYVASVSPNSGAAAAGLTVGDIVTAFDGEKVESASDLMLDVRGKNPGDVVTLTVVNGDGQKRDVQVTLGSDGSQPQTTQQGSGIMDMLQRNQNGQGA